jgi:uncharacterized membrane protein required for colicin V production
MTAIKPKKEKRTFARLIPPLIIGTVGVFGVVALYYFIPKLQVIEFVPLLIIVGACAIGYLRCIIRGILSIVTVYIATVAAAFLYRAAAPFVNAILEVLSFNLETSVEDLAPLGAQAFAFALITVFVWFMLELVRRATFQTPELPQIGILDNVGGLVVHLVLGVLIASLLFNTAGYGRSRPSHDQAYFRRTFNQVLYLHYTTQSFWFEAPPPIYAYDMHTR